MNYAVEYLAAIKSGRERVSKKVRAVYEREVRWIEDPSSDFAFYFDEEAGQRPIDFIEKFCRHYEGKWGGKPVLLELFQKAKLQLAYGWKEKDTGLRRFREIVDIRGRKCGKSTETAGVEQFALIADGELGAKVYCTANKLDQAKIIFDAAAAMRAQSPSLRAITKKRQSDIYFPATLSSLKALAADTKTMDGMNAHFFSLDEFHEARDSKVYDVMIQSQAAREQPLAWLISTNGYVREMFFDNKYDYCSKVALWEDGYQDYRLLPLIYELDSRDEWTKMDCWAKANPGLGKIKSFTALADSVEKAKRDPTFLPTLLTKDFNMPENSNVAWLTYEAAVNETVVPMDYLKHSYAVGGCDLSAVRDLTCATLLLRKPNDANYYVLQHYFLPKSRVDEVESSGKREAPYRLWAKQGLMTICEGASVDFNAVSQWFVDMVKDNDIRPLWVGYDAALSGYWREQMEGYGFDMEKIRQGPFTWTYPMKQMGTALEEHRIVYQNHSILRWCLLNTAKKSTNKDGIESIAPVKSSSSKRIDGMVSLLNAWTCMLNHEDEYLRYVR